MPQKKSEHRRGLPIAITPVDPMEGCKIVKNYDAAPQQTDDMITSEIDVLSLGTRASDRIEAIREERSHPIYQAEWWKVTRCEPDCHISIDRICSYVYQDKIWHKMPTAKHWDSLIEAHMQMKALGEAFQHGQTKNCALSQVLEIFSFEMHIFGGTLAFGFWDGQSDVDFCFISRDAIDRGKAGSIQSIASLFVRKYNKLLRKIGWTHPGVIPIPHAKVPILKHKKGHFLRSNFTGLHVTFLAQNKLEVNIKNIASEEGLKLIAESISAKHIVLQYSASNDLSILKAYARMMPISLQIRTHFFTPLRIASLDFDLSFCARGIRNSWLLRAYLMQNDIARQGALYLKRWSKKAGVNDGSKGYLCSYAYVILWIYFLTFEKKFLHFVAPESIPEIPQECVDYKKLFRKLPAINKLDQSLGRLLYEFFAFYSCSFDWSVDIVSLRKMQSRRDIRWEKTMSANANFYLCIEDPYVNNLNLARALNEHRASDTFRAMSTWVSEVKLHAKCTTTSAKIKK